MNIQEAIKQVEQMGEYERFVDEPISKKSVLNILSQIDEPQKAKIPQLVADWLEIARRQHLSLGQAMDHWEMSEKIEKWFQYANNQEMFARAWLDGYEVEQEERYTVEIPNNRDDVTMALFNFGGEVILAEAHISYKRDKQYQLTESEIKQDFDWAWQWAKPAEVE